ncbi:MAG: FecR domain-containing protein [Oscillatoriales cyanobacterium SM2_2_1]|nr:FecR domain-containing protein [Oscillatoriales cyanobacterium SM2_2_1]
MDPISLLISQVLRASQPGTIAQINRIESPIVRIRPAQGGDSPAAVGVELGLGDTILTRDRGRTEVLFRNGVGVRLGGNAQLVLQPQNRLNLRAGEMITWVMPGKSLPLSITTPLATAAIRGTTVYVEYLPKGQIRFFAWEGRVSVIPTDGSPPLTLTTGEEVVLTPGQPTPPIRRMSVAEWQKHRQTARFLRSFPQPLPTQPLIDRLLPGEVP